MSPLERAQRAVRTAWALVIVAGVLLAGAREQLRHAQDHHDFETARLRLDLDGALEHIHRLKAATPQQDPPA